MNKEEKTTQDNALQLTPEKLLKIIQEVQGLPEEIVYKFLAAKGKLSRDSREKE